MKQQKNLRERYIQLVETFINAIESERSGTELEHIRSEIRMLSAQIDDVPTVENHTQKFEFLSLKQPLDKSNGEVDTTIS